MRDFFHTSVADTICLFSFLILTLTPTASAQYIGTIDTVGTTFWDYQHLGTAGRMISADSMNWVNVVWTGLSTPGNNQTHVYLNWYRPGYGWAYGNVGSPFSNCYRSSSCCLVPFDFVSPVIVFHGQQTAGDILNSWVCNPFQFIPSYTQLPLVGAEGTHDPKAALGRNASSHFISYATCPTGEPLSSSGLYYCRNEYDTTSHTWEFTPQQLIDCVTTLAGDISANRFSGRVTLVYADIRTTLQGDTNRYNNDIYLVVSEDGFSWDFDNPINVTDFIYPDSLTQNPGDTLRAYTDASIIFDIDDNIHIAFTTLYYNEIEERVSINNSLIWHWSETTGYYSLVADGWFGDDIVGSCGAWQRYAQRPCLARDETTGDLFITYQQYDTSDIAANGYPQAEVMISRSTDGGIRWSVGTNVSNTHAPGAAAGDCYHERDITCNETVENDTLHIFYILDKDAGSVVQSEGTWTENPAICQFVPIDQIPATPLMPIYPMHIDSTGMPPVVLVEPANNDNIPTTLALHQNYPNPFNPTTTISFDLNHTDHITLKIYNILGREITTLVDATLTFGTYKVPFTAENLSSGIYFCRMKAGDFQQVRKVVLLK